MVLFAFGVGGLLGRLGGCRSLFRNNLFGNCLFRGCLLRWFGCGFGRNRSTQTLRIGLSPDAVCLCILDR